MTHPKKNAEPNSNLTPEPTPELNFEGALNSLEQIVKTMESQQLSLEDSLKYFEQGVALSNLCAKKLSEAELKIKTISQNIK